MSTWQATKYNMHLHSTYELCTALSTFVECKHICWFWKSINLFSNEYSVLKQSPIFFVFAKHYMKILHFRAKKAQKFQVQFHNKTFHNLSSFDWSYNILKNSKHTNLKITISGLHKLTAEMTMKNPTKHWFLNGVPKKVSLAIC